MRMSTYLPAFSLALSTLLTATGAFGDEAHESEREPTHRQHGTHVHGIGQLNLALEGRELHLELDSPAANLVGFEHAPSSAADHAAIDKAVASLKEGDSLFRFNSEAGCRMHDVKIASALLEEEQGHGHGESEEHDHEHKHHAAETHADIAVTYHFECATPSALRQLEVTVFEHFPATEHLKVQFVVADRQGAAELSANAPLLAF